MSDIPYSVCLAGPGLDQPYLSRFNPGWNITASIKPTYKFNHRAGMATSTRDKAIEMWGNNPNVLYAKELDFTPHKLARILFRADNENKDGDYISGFQDAAGICMPGINAAWYEGDYFPQKFKKFNDDKTIKWLEENVKLMELPVRPSDYNLFKNSNLNEQSARKLRDSSSKALCAIASRNAKLLGQSMNEAREAYAEVFPESMPKFAQLVVDTLGDGIDGCKFNGAGGGGYLIMVTKHDVGIPIQIKR